MNSLGQKIKNLRKARNMTQSMLCDGLVTASMISQIESDRATPSASLLAQIAARLDVDISYFASDVSNKTDQVQNYRRARGLIEEHKFEEALPLLQGIAFPLAPQFKAETIYNDLANCYMQLGRMNDACEMYEIVVQTAFEKEDVATAVHAYYNLGNVERRRERMTVARMYWQRASELLERYPNMNMPVALKIEGNLGSLYSHQGNYEQAVKCYEKAARLAKQYSSNRDLAVILHGLCYVHIQLNLLDEANHYNQQASETYATSNNSRGVNQCQINHAVILHRAGRYEEALNHLSSLIRSRDFQRDGLRLANAYAERAQNQFVLGNADKALEDAKQAITLGKDNVELKTQMYLLRARSFVGKSCFEQALTELYAGMVLLASDDLTTFVEFRRVERTCLIEIGRRDDALQASLAFARDLLIS